MASANEALLTAIRSGDQTAAAGFLDRDPSLANAKYTEGGYTLPILYAACMSGHVALVKLLLERGAATQDGESIYHSAQDNRRECLELLLAHGADLSSTQTPFGNTPLYFLAGHHADEDGKAAWLHGFKWLLEHGADPNVKSYKTQEAPLHAVAASPLKGETALALLAHGADVNLRRGDGLTPYQIAVRRGNTAMALLFAERGADTSVLRPVDEFLSASLTADGGHARALLHDHPGLFDSMTKEDLAAITDALMHNRPDAIRLMVELGFRLDAEKPQGGTPIHWAAWLGKVDMVDLLVQLGSPMNLRDSQYGSSALGWAAHGSECHKGDDSYCAIVDTLIDAGATRELTINKWGETLEGSPRVAERLNARLNSGRT